MADCGGRVLWLDASSLVIKPLAEIRRVLETTGFVSTYTAGDIRTVMLLAEFSFSLIF